MGGGVAECCNARASPFELRMFRSDKTCVPKLVASLIHIPIHRLILQHVLKLSALSAVIIVHLTYSMQLSYLANLSKLANQEYTS